MSQQGVWLAGRSVAGRGAVKEIRTPFTEQVAGVVTTASADDVNEAIVLAHLCFKTKMRVMPVHERAAILHKVADALIVRAEELAVSLVQESGKPITLCRTEMRRGVDILRLAAEAARFVTGEIVPLDAYPGADNRVGLAVRTPLGVVAAISPSNAPINLSLQKIAPALASGCTVVLKPAEQTPLTVLKLGEIFAASGLPEGALSIVPGGGETGHALVSHPLVAVVSFTGSTAVARKIQESAGIKKFIYELGSNAPNIVCADANLDLAAQSLVGAAFNSSGQICLSAQRIYVHESVYAAFLEKFLPLVDAIKIGDPMDATVTMGTLIGAESLARIESWVAEAVAGGAKALTGGKRHPSGRNYMPTVLTDVNAGMKVQRDEVFGPVVTLASFATDDEAIAAANDTTYGLSGAVFTNDLSRAFRYINELDVGSVNVNDGSRFRQDNTPFSGVKNSGVGREGGRYAFDEYTYLKCVNLRFG